MKNKRIAVCDLAGELHVSSRELIRLAQRLGINVIRAAATLSSGQEYRLREAVANGRLSRRRQVAVVPTPEQRPARPRDELRHATCTCCGYLFSFVPLSESHEICRECRHHYEEKGESFVCTITRHEDHVAQSRKKVEQYRDASDKLSRERDEAYTKRNKWMAALVEIVVAHGPAEDNDGCVCGAEEFPCVTRRHLRQVNRGIYDRCEELEAKNEDEFNKILYGTDYSFFKEWDDGAA